MYDNYLRFIFILINYLSEINEDIGDIFDFTISFHEEIVKFETIKDINGWIINISDKIFDYLDKTRNKLHSRAIIKALKFIKSNFNDKNLDLKLISEYVELSPSHFSRLFLKETGANFCEYLTDIRINEAKRLFRETNMKVYEVCFAIGYDNVEHFSRMFKKNTGFSPNNFNKF